MADYSKEWDKLENNRNYIETADIVIPERSRLIKTLVSFFNHFIKKDIPKILDLGCGDGILTKNIYLSNNKIKPVVTDGSSDMINKAKENLKNIADIKFAEITFEEIINNKLGVSNFDFIYSSLAIHHLVLNKKKELFKSIYNLLNKDGYFLNIDTCITENKQLLTWYYKLWEESIIEIQKKINTEKDYSEAPYHAPKKPENHFDDIEIQLKFLKESGFKNVELYYKSGIFCIYGGMK